jgi:hypothetical protein
MEENRFLRAYQEHKKEKEQAITPNYDNRFQCLRTSYPVRENDGGGRFECLKSDNYVSYPSSQDVRTGRDQNNRFACLASDGYQSYPRQPERVHYLPRPEPRESINTQMRRYQDERKASLPPPPKPPVFSFESEFHFPELGKTPEPPSNSKMPKPKEEIKLPEPKPPKEMIVKPVLVPIEKKTMTLLKFSGNKVVTTEVYEDGTDIPETGIVMVKKPNYSSWASVLKPESTETVYYDVEEKKILDINKGWHGKN